MGPKSTIIPTALKLSSLLTVEVRFLSRSKDSLNAMKLSRATLTHPFILTEGDYEAHTAPAEIPTSNFRYAYRPSDGSCAHVRGGRRAHKGNDEVKSIELEDSYGGKELTRIYSLWRSKEGSDFTITCGPKEFKVHSFLLKPRSTLQT